MRQLNDDKVLSRSEYVARNATVSLITQIVKNLLGFVTRTVFIWVMGKELLGINSLFTEIMTMLSFAELGIGNAFVYSLYKPLATNDTEHLKSLMSLFARAYRWIGVAVGGLGLALLPFLKLIVGDVGIGDGLLYSVYLLYVFNSAVSYFFVYRTSLITADQKNYVVLIVQESVHFVQTIIQVVLLYLTRDFLIYTAVNVAATISSNAILAWWAGKKYPYLKQRDAKPLDASERRELVTNVKSLIVYKIGEKALGSTDNIFISAIINVATVGMYSNYQLLVDLFSALGGQVMNSVTASVGNANATVDEDRKEQIFNGALCACAWFFGLAATGIFLLSNAFISLWVGADYCLDLVSIFCIVLTFYVNNMHYPCITYRYTTGIFRFGKWMPIIAAVINITMDIVLGNLIGLPGILLATVIARIATYEIVDPMIIYKHVFKRSVAPYFLRYGMYAGFVVISCAASWAALQAVPLGGWLGFVADCFVVLVAYSAVFFLLSWRTSGFSILKAFIGNIAHRH